MMKKNLNRRLETPDRRPSGGSLSPEGDEFGNCEDAGKHFGILGGIHGSCEAAVRGGQEGGDCEAALRGGALGNCEQARKGGRQLTPEAIEKCRQSGKEHGIKGKDWGKYGGRPPSSESLGSAPPLAQKALVRPSKWEPKVGNQLIAVKFIREQLRARREGGSPGRRVLMRRRGKNLRLLMWTSRCGVRSVRKDLVLRKKLKPGM